MVQSPYNNYKMVTLDGHPVRVSGTCRAEVPVEQEYSRVRFTVRGKPVTRQQAEAIMLGKISWTPGL